MTDRAGFMPGAIEDTGLGLAELLCARLCHDLGNPLGTIANALGLAQSDPDSAVEALDVASQAAAILTGRVRLYRTALGGDSGELDAPALGALLRDACPRRVELEVALSGWFGSGAARVTLCLGLLGLEALPFGGRLVVAGSPGEGVLVAPAGRKAGWREGVATILAGTAKTDDPRLVLAMVAAALARREGLTISPLLGNSGDPAPLLLAA